MNSDVPKSDKCTYILFISVLIIDLDTCFVIIVTYRYRLGDFKVVGGGRMVERRLAERGVRRGLVPLC